MDLPFRFSLFRGGLCLGEEAWASCCQRLEYKARGDA